MSAEDHLSSQFDMRSGFKNKPNSQGTLFRADPSQRKPEARQPRGYSPERYREVTEALDIRFKDRGPGTYGGHEHGGRSMHIYHGHAETIARAAAAVARSTVPLSDMTRPDPNQPASPENPKLEMGVWVGDDSHERGHYSKPGTTAIPERGGIALFHHADDITPIHEIGHHVDRAELYRTPAQKGRAEGFADAYAAEHARTPGYKQQRVPVESHPSEWHNEPGLEGYSRREEFDRAYLAQRGEPKPFDAMEDTRRTLGSKTFPPHHVPGQQALLHKTATYDPAAAYVNGRAPVKDIRWVMPDWASDER